MGSETERKFLVTGDGWKQAATSSRHIVQGYLALGDEIEARVRIFDAASARLTIKSRTAQLTRAEFEYPIPLADAEAMLDLCGDRRIEKVRHLIPAPSGGGHWDVDLFTGPFAGLCLAERELDEGADIGPLPEWVGREVTGDARYYNASLALAAEPPEAL